MRIHVQKHLLGIIVAVVGYTACAHTEPTPTPTPTPAPIAHVGGRGISLDLPQVTGTSDDCIKGDATLLQTLPASLRRGAEKALTESGFVVQAEPDAKAAMTAHVDASVTYCNPSSQIATGEIALSVSNKGQVVARVVVNGDLANPMDDLFAQLGNDLIHTKGLIDATGTNQESGAKPETGGATK